MNRLLAAVLGALVLATAGLVIASPAAASAPPGRIVIGDSVTGMAPGLLTARGFRVDYAVSRQFSHARGIMSRYGASLPRNVVIALGTNGYVSLSECRAVVRAAGPDRRVFLVTNRVPRAWEGPNNATMRECDRSFTASRVHIVDWWGLSDSHPSWFYPEPRDGYHPTESVGAPRFARLIDAAVDRYGR